MDPFRDSQIKAIHQALHELCQPLTALHCRLELGQILGDQASLKEAVDGGLEEAQRIFATVARVRAWLRVQDEAALVDVADHHRAIQ